MEVLGVDESKKAEVHMTSAAAFVEGGIQESCDDACSICLEDFCDSDPATLTTCKHEFHLHCILEWCQRSSQCPMCWQAISLKDPTSQDLLEAVEHERNLRAAPSRNTTIFHHPTLGDFELRHLPVGTSDAELEERIIQHLAAAAAMGRSHHLGRRESQRHRSSPHGRPHFLVFSTHPSAPSSGHVSSSPTQVEGENEIAAGAAANPSTSHASAGHTLLQQAAPFPSALIDQSSSTPGTTIMTSNRQGTSLNYRSTSNQTPPSNQTRAGPSDFQSFSESLKSRFNAVSMRYKESISKSTRGWKERLFSRTSSMADLGSEVHREENAGIATVSRVMESLETTDNSRANQASVSTHAADYSVAERSNQSDDETQRESNLNGSTAPTHCATSSPSA